MAGREVPDIDISAVRREQTARHVEAALRAATSVVLDDCGHVAQDEPPERSHARVRESLEDSR